MKNIFKSLTKIVLTLLVLAVFSVSAFASEYGDIDGNGTVNTKDLTRLMRYIAGYEVDVFDADLNDDSLISTKDLTRLMKHIAGECIHIPVIDNAIEATCSSEGLTEGSHCSVCQTVIIKQNIIAKTNHNYNNGKCSNCGALDPNYNKTPDLVLGAYIQQNGVKQSDGTYAISKIDSSADMTILTQIYWDPAEQSLLFAEQSTTSTGVLTVGILFEYGSNQQRITAINQVMYSQFTGIGYIYADTYSISNETIDWLSYECNYPSLLSENKQLSESGISLLMMNTSNFLEEINIGVSLRDIGFVKWFG